MESNRFLTKTRWVLGVLLGVMLGFTQVTATSRRDHGTLPGDANLLSPEQLENLKTSLQAYSHQGFSQQISLNSAGRITNSQLVPFNSTLAAAETAGPAQPNRETSLAPNESLREGVAQRPLQIQMSGPVILTDGKQGVLISVIVINQAALDGEGNNAGDSWVKTQLISDLGTANNFVPEAYQGETPWKMDSAWQEFRISISAAAVAKLQAQGIGVNYIFQLAYDLKTAAPELEVKKFYSRATTPVSIKPAA